MAIIAIIAGLIHHHKAVVVPEGMIVTQGQGFEAIWVPEGMEGPVVALPLDERAF